ncbi:T9SS type A sorting domain-containing protein [Bacteroidales bacterium AH-315-N07]|nr:T9SS type A sorting domain-containing protein [Bacteroidales bacterium AH-315-N07]
MKIFSMSFFKLLLFLGALCAVKFTAFSQWGILNTSIKMNLNAVYFTDSKTGFVVGDSGVIFKTVNSGKDWSNISYSDSINLNDVFFTSSDVGFIAAENATLITTNNGGLSWQKQIIGSVNFNGVNFIDSNSGILVGDNGLILKTSNGGSDWSLIVSGVIYYLSSVFYVDDTTIYSTGSNGTALKSSDGGTSWSILNSTTISIISGVDFVNGDTGYVVGNDGVLLKTANGGNSFSKITTSVTDWLRDIYCVREGECHIAGQNGNIYKLTDDSITKFESQISDGTTWLKDIHFADQYTGFAVGTNGVIMQTCPHADFSISESNLNLGDSSHVYFTNNSSNYTSSKWYFGDSDSSETTDPKHDYTAAGFYTITLKVFNETGCVDSVKKLLVTSGFPKSIYEINEVVNVNVFPNPADDILNIEYFLNNEAHTKIELFNILGVKVKTFVQREQLAGKHLIHIDLKKNEIVDNVYILKMTLNKRGFLYKKILLTY